VSRTKSSKNQDWKGIAEAWVEKRYLTALSYCKDIVKGSIEKGFMRETGKWDVEGLQVYMNKLVGLETDNMES